MPPPPNAACNPGHRRGSAPRTSRPISTRGRANSGHSRHRPLTPRRVPDMRSILLVLCAALIGGGALLAVGTTKPVSVAAPAATADTGDKAAFGRRVRDYLIGNPEVL